MKEVARLSRYELEARGVVRVAYPPFDVVVVHRDGEFFALEDACNHAGARLSEGDVDGCAIRCPMHGYLFDLRSGELVAPRGLCGPQRRYEVRAEGDMVVVVDAFALRVF